MSKQGSGEKEEGKRNGQGQKNIKNVRIVKLEVDTRGGAVRGKKENADKVKLSKKKKKERRKHETPGHCRQTMRRQTTGSWRWKDDQTRADREGGGRRFKNTRIRKHRNSIECNLRVGIGVGNY